MFSAYSCLFTQCMCAILSRMFKTHDHVMPKLQQEKQELDMRLRRIFARNLRVARDRALLNQGQLAKMVGLTQPFLSDVENAKSTISLDNANALASAVGQPLSKLLTDTEK